MGGKKSSITNVVREARKDAGLSQQDLGSAVGVTRQTVISIEAQRYAPSLELAFRLSHVLETPIEELFAFKPDWD